MQNLHHQRCFNHATREAAARCPECGRFFCRECVTEHDDRVVCSACLSQLARKPVDQRPAFARLARFGQYVAGLLIAWFFFYLIGEGLLRIPAQFHDGTLWQVNWIDRK
jgi:uncharacterized protein (DUF983 family)